MTSPEFQAQTYMFTNWGSMSCLLSPITLPVKKIEIMNLISEGTRLPTPGVRPLIFFFFFFCLGLIAQGVPSRTNVCMYIQEDQNGFLKRFSERSVLCSAAHRAHPLVSLAPEFVFQITRGCERGLG